MGPMGTATGGITRERITADLNANLGVRHGDIIAVHSSLKSLGFVEEGPVTVIEGLLDAVGGEREGTLMMPCFTRPSDEVDLRRAPCRVGLIPEAFRSHRGVVRSENWSHSVAVTGRFSDEIASTHRGREPLDLDTPFHELAKRGGYILHIGCDMSTCSLIHVAEAIAGAPYFHIGYEHYAKPMRLIVDDTRQYSCRTKQNPGCSKRFTHGVYSVRVQIWNPPAASRKIKPPWRASYSSASSFRAWRIDWVSLKSNTFLMRSIERGDSATKRRLSIMFFISSITNTESA